MKCAYSCISNIHSLEDTVKITMLSILLHVETVKCSNKMNEQTNERTNE